MFLYSTVVEMLLKPLSITFSFAGKTAILSSLNKFVSVNNDDDSIVATSVSASELEFCNIRSNRSRTVQKVDVPEEEGDLTEVEVNYV